MYRNYNSFDPFMAMIYLSIVLIFVVVPITAYINAVTLQKAINDTCGSKYTLIQVAISGDKLQQLCKIKEQQITIRNQIVK
jgi:cell division protein YceG involved in septum cleavage